MDRVLALIGLSVLTALLALFLLIPPVGDDPRQTNPAATSDTTSWSNLTDEEKLERLENAGDPSDERLVNRAVAYNDASYCEDVSDDWMRERCLSLVDTSAEDDAVTTTQEDRILNRAVAYGEPSRCDAIGNVSVRERCREQAS